MYMFLVFLIFKIRTLFIWRFGHCLLQKTWKLLVSLCLVDHSPSLGMSQGFEFLPSPLYEHSFLHSIFLILPKSPLLYYHDFSTQKETHLFQRGSIIKCWLSVGQLHAFSQIPSLFLFSEKEENCSKIISKVWL